MPEGATHRVFRFEVFEADEVSGELRKHGIRIKLHSQPFKVLTMLLERPSAIVTREEMRQRLWGAETFVDFDHGLNTAVNKIREALGDSASAPRYVETVSGKGYRFLVPVTLQTASGLSDVNVATVAEIRGANAAPAALFEQVSGSRGVAADAGLLAMESSPAGTSATGFVLAGFTKDALLTTPDELPVISPKRVRTLLVLIQIMYLAFYLGALGNLSEIHDIFLEAGLPHAVALISLLITTAAVLIPIRLFIVVAVALNFPHLPSKFGKLFPVLLILDLLWAVSPFLLIHHINTGLALGLSAPLVYVPFAQRSLVLIYSRGR